ncbi:MAG: DUF2062 domain-containing protein [Bacteroidetes bacterium]|nr:DUF2062 domain-containing protein [Bacteroidota bacterium]
MPGSLTKQNLLRDYQVCVILPTYNNCKTLAGVIRGVLQLTDDLIVVDDGSTDDTVRILSEFPSVHVVRIPLNKGKGNALKTGFAYAMQKGFRYAVSMDTDGQHQPSEIIRFAEKLNELGDALIIGERNMEQSSVPVKSNFGRKFSNFWFWVETGISHNDTQSGFRLYPLAPMEKMKFYTPRFEFEIEIIVRLAWKGIKVSQVPVTVHYFDEDERVSHFRPFQDFVRISLLNTVLVFLALTWYRPVMYFRDRSWKELLFNPKESILLRSVSVSVGVFMGIFPVWGFQLLIAIGLAFLFKLNKALVILFVNISIPPFIPLIIYFSLVFGSFWFKNPVLPSLDTFRNLSSVTPFIEQYLIGSITLSFAASILSGAMAYFILILYSKNKR